MTLSTNGKGSWLQSDRTLPASARVMGLHVLAARGTGKSRLLGRLIAMQDFLAGIPQIPIDPTGATIDNFLDKVARFLRQLTPSQHEVFWSRITYMDMSGKAGRIMPFPLYYKLGSERSLLEIADGTSS